jgi:chromosome segregation ATPase
MDRITIAATEERRRDIEEIMKEANLKSNTAVFDHLVNNFKMRKRFKDFESEINEAERIVFDIDNFLSRTISKSYKFAEGKNTGRDTEIESLTDQITILKAKITELSETIKHKDETIKMLLDRIQDKNIVKPNNDGQTPETVNPED